MTKILLFRQKNSFHNFVTSLLVIKKAVTQTSWKRFKKLKQKRYKMNIRDNKFSVLIMTLRRIKY